MPTGVYERPSLEERFWAKVEVAGKCWVWTDHIGENGYGQLRNGRTFISAHRYSYQLLRGVVPDGLVINHVCKNKTCVNPDHLEAVPQFINKRRGKGMKLKNRDVRKIRRLFNEGSKQSNLADAFDVSQSHISRIISGERWKEVCDS